MKWTFALKEQGTSYQGWWLKISSLEELLAYHELKNPQKYEELLNNYMSGKHRTPSTEVIYQYASKNSLTILEAINNYELIVNQNQVNELFESGAIYINCVGGYHGAYKTDPEFLLIEREELIFPENDYVPNKHQEPKPNKKIDYQPYGWLSPMGEYYEAEWGDHEDTAQEIIDKLHIINDKDTYRDKLSDLGWVLIHDPGQTNNYKITYIKPLTKHQSEFLYNFFFDLGQPIKAESYLKDDNQLYEER